MELDVSSQQVLFQVACTLQTLAKNVDNNTADNLTVLQTEVNSLLEPMVKVQKDIEAQKLMVKKVEDEFDDLIKEVEKVLESLLGVLANAGLEYKTSKEQKHKSKILENWVVELKGYEARLREIFGEI
jgi:hypothetical protein